MSDGAPPSPILDGVRERFDSSTDFTIGLEEEFQLLDPVTLGLVNRYEDLMAQVPPELAERLAGELIASEVEYKTRAHDTYASAARQLAEGRLLLIGEAERAGIALAITGVHPFSTWPEQRIIDTPHYRLVEGELGYIAWVNNTWAFHIHCGVRGADRAIRVSTAMRSVLPELLALSANSPLFWSRDTRLASTRTQTFVRSFPRCGIPDAFTSWDEYEDHVRLLERTGSIIEGTQIWWSIRPHHSFGTVEVRICDGQTELADTLAVGALALACIARFCADADAGRPLPVHRRGLIEENLWRAQRHGLDGELIDLDRGVVRSTREAVAALVEESVAHHGPLGIGPFMDRVAVMLAEGNGAIRQRTLMAETGGDLRAVHAEAVRRTRESAHEVLAALPAEAPSPI